MTGNSRKKPAAVEPTLPDTARSILKALLVSLAGTGLITAADAQLVISLLRLGDA